MNGKWRSQQFDCDFIVDGLVITNYFLMEYTPNYVVMANILMHKMIVEANCRQKKLNIKACIMFLMA